MTGEIFMFDHMTSRCQGLFPPVAPTREKPWERGWESGAAVAYDVYPGTKHRGGSVSFLYLLEKMERKTNHSNIFWNKNVQRLRIKLRSSTFDNCELTQSLLRALRASYSISSDDGEDLFADELLVY